jgi:hypothetical protein
MFKDFEKRKELTRIVSIVSTIVFTELFQI